MFSVLYVRDQLFPHMITDICFQNSQASKAFLFDSISRLYVATDASPVDQPTHSLCSEYLHMLNSFGPLYRYVAGVPVYVFIPNPVHQLDFCKSTKTTRRSHKYTHNPSRASVYASVCLTRSQSPFGLWISSSPVFCLTVATYSNTSVYLVRKYRHKPTGARYPYCKEA